MDFIIGTPGFSEKLLKTHFKLYEAYVQIANELGQQMSSLVTEEKEKTPVFAELRRRFGWEFNGMRLHELYFGNMGGKEPISSSASFHQAATRSYGNFDIWKRDFVGTGSMRGIGWAILFQDPATGHLTNPWVTLDRDGVPAGFRPLVVMDVWVQAFMRDYQATE